jgi:outer membrane protein TolC
VALPLWGLSIAVSVAAAETRIEAPADDARTAGGRGSVRLALREAIAMARTQSPSALVAIHRYRSSHWQYVTFKADYRPSLDLATTPLEWERTIDRQTLPDGTDAFVPRSQANSSADLSLNKVVSWTGGRIALRSEIARTEALEGDGGTQFFSKPLLLSYSQPLFAFNSYAWGLRIEPRRYAEAGQQLVEEMEGVSSTAITYFFDLLSAQTSLRDALKEKAQADTLYAVVRRRFGGGRAPQSDVLQAELASLNADLRLARVEVDVAVKQQRLGTFLGVGEDPNFELTPATDVPIAEVDLATAISQARRNRSQAQAFDRQLLEADRSVAQARATGGYTSLYASYGLSRSTDMAFQLYREPRVDQQALLSVRMPILDWGRSRARVAVAESQREVTRRQVEQARADFERDVFLRVSQFDIQARQLRLAARADSVAQRRHEMTRERYLAGQADLNSVNIAQVEKENARRGYLDAMRNYWATYYDVRRATLYDFEGRQALGPPEVRF